MLLSLHALLENILPRSRAVEASAVELEFSHIGRKIIMLKARLISRHARQPSLIVSAINK
jgi:hypothetical protein